MKFILLLALFISNNLFASELSTLIRNEIDKVLDIKGGEYLGCKEGYFDINNIGPRNGREFHKCTDGKIINEVTLLPKTRHIKSMVIRFLKKGNKQLTSICLNGKYNPKAGYCDLKNSVKEELTFKNRYTDKRYLIPTIASFDKKLVWIFFTRNF